jgi:hypothetical protein
MKYQKLINLGFERKDYDDNGEFNELGVKGYYLNFKLKDNLYLEIDWKNLNKIELQIMYPGEGDYWMYVSEKQMKKLIKKHKIIKDKYHGF